jgi:hypothetical protein
MTARILQLLTFAGNKLFYVVWLAVIMLFTLNVSAEIKKKPPVVLKSGIFIKNITPDFKSSSFRAEFYWWFVFENDSTKTGMSNEDIMKVEFVNGIEVEPNAFANEKMYETNPKPNTYYVTGFHQGNFYFNPDFRMYPFDKQRMDIIIENAQFTSDKLIIVADTSSYLRSKQDAKFRTLSNDILNNNDTRSFHIYKTGVSQSITVYNSDFGDVSLAGNSSYGKLVYSVFIDRSILPYISKFVIPLMIILLLVYFVYFLPADKIDTAAALTVTSLLSSIAFQSSVNGDLPEIAYVIYVDKLFYTSYFLIAISMAISLWLFNLNLQSDKPSNLQLSRKILFLARILFPLTFILAVVLFAL